MRKFIVLLATLAVVSFGHLFISGDTAYAADASWDKDTSSQMQRVKYDGKLFEGPFTAVDGDGTRLEQGSYYYVNKKDEKAYVVYFAPGTSPPEATSATYQEYDFQNASYSNPSDKRTISITPQDPEQAGELTTCSVEGIGWIVCPVTRYLAKGMDWIYSIISDFLQVQPLQSVQTNALYKMWEIGRNFANILFIIGFLILIYGQISGGLLDNYTIKKMLPRIIIAAILVNISYWICAVGIDISNILGYAVQDLFINVRESITNTPMAPISWENATEVVLTAGTAGVATGVLGVAAFMSTGGSVAAAVFLLLPALVGVILAALVALIVLAMRQALITILVIIAPIAFVAYLLPNTEKWFERWRGTFMTMLLLFPIFSLIFGGSQLAGTAIIMTAQSPAIAILGMIVMVAPLVITPLVIKFSGSVLGRIAGMINNPNKGLIDRTRNFANPRAEMYKNRNLARANTGINRFGAGRVARKMYRGQVNREKRAEGYKKAAENRAHEWEAKRLSAGPERLRTFANNYQSKKEYGYWDAQYKDAELRHKEIHGEHDSHYWAATRNAAPGSVGARRREMAENAQIYEGQAKTYQDAVNSSAENTLQRQVARNYHGLGDAKTESVVQSGLAESAKKLTDAQGNLALKQTIANDRAFTYEAEVSTRFEKQAAIYDSIVQKAAEQSWNSRVEKDQNTRQLYLQSIEAEQNAKKAEQVVAKLTENVTAMGSQAPILQTKAEKDIAQSIKQTAEATSIVDQTISSAKIVQQRNLATALKENAELRTEAAGVDTLGGENRVLAAAKKAVSDELIKATSNFQDTLDYDIASNPTELAQRFRVATDATEKIVYARLMARNAPGLIQLKDVLREYTSARDPQDDEVMLLKEVLAGDDTFRNAGRDMEVWANNERKSDGTLYNDFEDVQNTISVINNISADRFTRMNAYKQLDTLYRLQENDPEAFEGLVRRINASPIARNNLKQRVIDAVDGVANGEPVRNPDASSVDDLDE